MKRTIDHYLLEWKKATDRKPLILRGARQVGKTYAVRELAKTFPNSIEINLEIDLEARKIFEKDLDARRIVSQLATLTQKNIKPGSTLLFIDEIQNVPQAITSLRYFYELIPELHVIAAGSLVDFAIIKEGMPVGRVTARYMYPLTFIEFLVALGNERWARAIIEGDLAALEVIHEQLLSLLGIYLAVGGMPKAVMAWAKKQSSLDVKPVHEDLLFNYEEDFDKYARKHQIKYLNLLFQKAIHQLAHRFVFSHLGEYQKRELYPALELMEKAGLFYPVLLSAGQGIPIGAQANPQHFKIIFLDVGLGQSLLKVDLSNWFLEPEASFINKGEVVEAFVGQELLGYSDPIRKETLFYWQRESRGSEAEIDYLIQIKDRVIPIEVKAGINKRIKSMHVFLDSHQHSPYGIRFWAGKAEVEDRIKSYPLYSVAQIMAAKDEQMREALLSLTTE